MFWKGENAFTFIVTYVTLALECGLLMTIQGWKNAVANSTGNLECANVFLHFTLHAYACCMAKLI